MASISNSMSVLLIVWSPRYTSAAAATMSNTFSTAVAFMTAGATWVVRKSRVTWVSEDWVISLGATVCICSRARGMNSMISSPSRLFTNLVTNPAVYVTASKGDRV